MICAGDKTENNFLYFFTELKTSHLFYSIYKHDANDIAYPSSNHRMRVIYVLRNLLTIDSLWLSGRASEREIRWP